MSDAPPDPLEEIYALCAAGRTDAMLDAIMDHVDGLLCDGRFTAASLLLERVDLARVDDNAIAGFLAITLPAWNRIASRPAFVARAKEHVRSTMDADDFDDLFKGLDRYR